MRPARSSRRPLEIPRLAAGPTISPSAGDTPPRTGDRPSPTSSHPACETRTDTTPPSPQTLIGPDMKPRSVPSPTVPDEIREPLLRLAREGVTTDAAASELGLTRVTAWRYLELLRVEGVVHLRPTEDGRGAQWKTSNRRSK